MADKAIQKMVLPSATCRKRHGRLYQKKEETDAKKRAEAAKENSSCPTQKKQKKQDVQPAVTKIKRKSKKLVKEAIKNAHL